MNYLYIILLIVFIYFISSSVETFKNQDDYNQYRTKILKITPKKDDYMEFLGNLRDSYDKYLKEETKNSNTPIRQKIMCDDRIRKRIMSQALNDAFDTVKPLSVEDSQLFDKNIPDISKVPFTLTQKTDRQCPNRSSTLCERTDPMLYMSQNTRFPPRWIFKPYKDIPLPKHTDLNCWNNMLNCCKKNV